MKAKKKKKRHTLTQQGNKSPIHANLKENDWLISETLKTSGQAFKTRRCQGRRVVQKSGSADTLSRGASNELITPSDGLGIRKKKKTRKKGN